jgi:glycosyltransferase involved in cell wall biosynthesis
MSSAPLVTVFTPTYNRAHTLHRVFDSLCVQTWSDFEWLVVDDGSNDKTPELIDAWSKRANFRVRYFRQDHAGKHIAHNRALKEAHGYFFACVDSDDALPPEALENLMSLWNSIPERERLEFYGVGGLCCDQSGGIVGDRFPTDPFDADARELTYIHHIKGEKWGFGLTGILRRHPFPDVPGAQFIPEGIVWLSVAKTFKIRWTNEVVRTYYINDRETGATLSERVSLGDHALGRLHYYTWLLNNDLDYFLVSPLPFLKAAVILPVVGWSSGKSVGETLTLLDHLFAKVLVSLALPFSLLLYGIGVARTKKLSLSAGTTTAKETDSRLKDRLGSAVD